MKFIYKNLKSDVVSANPTTLNLQPRPFAPNYLASSQDDNVGIASSHTYTKKNSSENLLEKLISSSNSEQSAKPIQRKPYARLAAIRAQRMSTAIQAKLNIGAPNDKYEKEADATAAKVVKQINAPSQEKSVQRQESMEDEDQLQMKPEISTLQRQESMEEESEELQMKSILQRRENLNDEEAPSDLESSIQNARGSGQPLDSTLQAKMGQTMGADFSGVKVHTDAQSDQLNKSIQAKAFTTGKDVFFRQGAYNPSSSEGQELIAHELTHVVQQDSNQSIQRKIDFKPEKLSGMVSTKAKIASTFTEEGLSTLQRIKLVLKEYSKINDPKVEANMLAFLKSQSELWLAQHKYTKTKKGRQKTALINELIQSIIAEQASIARAENYAKDLKDNKFQFLTPESKRKIVNDDQSNHPAAPIAQKYGLLEGEMRAIRMYAGNEYIYINPIIAKNEAWLNSQIPKYVGMHNDLEDGLPDFFKNKNSLYDFSDDERMRLNEEANTHADVAISGLKKLPNMVKQCFRGLGLSEAEFKAQYEDKVGQTISFPSFTSTSRDIITAKLFAGTNSRQQGRVGILLKMNVKFGKDINKISGAGEAEILLLPNAQFKIDSIEDSVNGYKQVVLTQVA